MGGNGLKQIGEVATRTGLSLRTIRYYEEVGLVEPSARSQGGFRLYTDTDVQRLLLIARMKPLEFTLEQMRQLLDATDRLTSGARLAKSERARLRTTLGEFRQAIQARCATLREQLATAQAFDAMLAEQLEQLEPQPATAAKR
jgi:MerR family transcriptional regulator, copper efflux regulator